MSCFFVLSCFIVLALIDQGGQPSFFLHVVKIPLLIKVIFLSPVDETPSNLGSFSETSKTSLWISILVFYFAIDLKVYNFGILFLYLFVGSFLLGSAGFIAGLHCEKFDHMATITNFFIVPLSFLSGTFYSIEKLPIILQKISLFNPFFHIIDGFRYAVIGNSDGPILFGFIYLLLLSILLWIVCFYLYKKGYKIKF